MNEVLETSQHPSTGNESAFPAGRGVAHPLWNFVQSLGAKSGLSFELVLPDGHRIGTGMGAPVFRVVFRSDAALLATLTRGHIGLLESYFEQSVDLEGDIGKAFAGAMAAGFDLRASPLNAIENRIHEWRHSNATPEQAKENARAHYGLGADFYRLWLDEPLMMYTCGYWPEGTHSLEEAQRRKIDHVCRKLRLGRDERFVDIGCGFGGFMFRPTRRPALAGPGEHDHRTGRLAS
jgi:Cyclopropane fatty acid synthase and related methyltransferases